MAKTPEEIKAELAGKRPAAPVLAATGERSQKKLHVELPRAQSGKNGPEPDTRARSSPKVNARRELPQSIDAEIAVLGVMLQFPRETIPAVGQRVQSNFFFSPPNQLLFAAITTLFGDEGMVDLVTLTQHLFDTGQIQAVGGPAYVTSLQTGPYAPAMLDYYVEILRDKYALREILRSHTEVEKLARTSTDVSEIIALYRENAERLANLGAGHARLPLMRDLSSILGPNKPARPPELVKSVLHQGSKLIVGGTSKGRKTFALLDLAISVATGAAWWGFECVQGKVCYINFEIQEAFFAQRVEDICEKKAVTLPAGMLMGWNLRGHGEGIENMIADLMAVLRSRQFVLIIFDPIYKALGNRDENKAGDVASMLNELERIAVQTGAAIAFGAHYSKGNQSAKESIDRIGGSGVFARDPDSILTMTAHEEDDAFTVETTLRNFRPLDPFVVKWEWPLFQRQADLDPEQLRQPKKANSGSFTPKFSTNDILECLSVLDGVRPSTLKNSSNKLRGMSKATFYRLAGELERKHLLIERDGHWFRGSGEPK